ncbi:MlaD family protein [Spongiactinospora sp. TRM90649]|uniref:MlaD family protein n=1 Tax=Spongiactinospora sp. TRM90649 TaxID=3031114 RepID=UPI0023F71D82|nr:MlaD family protein [Spongiactinospora sp. TRM90649]MDF5755906.1 MlaD family protein [Spongiactinospora sp. TRM90649]
MALKSFRDRNRVAVGVITLVVLAAVVAGTFLAGALGLFERGYAVTAVLADAGGLRGGEDVRVAGVRSGEVTGVRADYARGRVVISMRVDEQVRLGRGARAEVTLSNLLSGRYVRLSGPAAPPYLDELPEASRSIPIARTSTPVLVNDALDDTTRFVRGLDAGAVDRLLGELARVEPVARGRIESLLGNVGELSELIDESAPDLRALLAGGERIVDVLDAKDREIGRLAAAVRAVLGELRLRRDELRALLGDGSDLVDRTSELIRRHERGLAAVVDDVSAVAGRLESQREPLNSLLAWAGPTFSGLAATGGRGEWLDAIATGLGPLDPELLGLLRPRGAR